MRVNIIEILSSPVLRKELMIRTLIATQAREGVVTTLEQAEEAYENVRKHSLI